MRESGKGACHWRLRQALEGAEGGVGMLVGVGEREVKMNVFAFFSPFSWSYEWVSARCAAPSERFAGEEPGEAAVLGARFIGGKGM